MATKSSIDKTADFEEGSFEASWDSLSSPSGDDTNTLLDDVGENAGELKDECMDLEGGSIVINEASAELEEASFDPQYFSWSNRQEMLHNNADDDAKEMEKENYHERIYEEEEFHSRNKAKHSSFSFPKKGMKKGYQKFENTDAGEDDENDLHLDNYPRDCYSFISLYGPTLRDLKSIFSRNGLSANMKLFGLGILVFLFQCALASAMWFSVLDPKWGTREEDNPGISTLANIIAANASPVLQATQFIALLSYVVFAEASLLDMITAIETFPIHAQKDTSGDQEFMAVEETDRGKLWCQYLSCILRFVQGFLVITAAFFLVVTSDTAVEVVLNFAAVNFISELDNVAFQMALDGRYGKTIRENAKRIKDFPLPPHMRRKNNRSRFKWISRLLGILLLGFMTMIYVAQTDINIWRTKVVRVEFEDGNVKGYSGCYYQHQRENLIEAFKRDTHMDNKAMDNARFGYCGDDRRWILFKDDDEDEVLDLCNLRENKKLAYSEKTNSFDLATGLKGGWYTTFGAPLNFYMIEFQKNNEGDCSLLGDGECNPGLNRPKYNYDGGDCCSATCSHLNCGKVSIMEAFNGSNVTGHGFPQCKDTSMVPITIHLGNFKESGPLKKNIIEPNLVFECDEKVVLSVHVSKDMMNSSETVLVNDRADCTLRIVNQFSSGSTIWFVDYSIFIGDKVNDSKKIIEENSENTGAVDFVVIPECMLEKLSKQVDILEMYKDPHAKKAMNWIAKDEGNSNCQDNYFTERFALSVLNFASPVTSSPWFNSNPTCLWFTAECEEGVPSTLSLIYMEMKGALTSYIQLLQSFSTIHMNGNGLTGSIPTEIGALTALTDLSIYGNDFSGTIPTEIGKLTGLKYLSLSDNNLRGTIPTEIGKLTRLTHLILSDNDLTGTIPSEIGKLTGLTDLSLAHNLLTGTLQTEFGSLAKLISLSLWANKLTGVIPNELGLLTELAYIDLANNQFSGTIPPFLQENKVYWFGKNNQFTGFGPDKHPKTPKHPFWDNNWPSDLVPTNQYDALLEGTVLFAQAQIIPSKNGIKNDKQPHLAALRKTLVMLKMHREEWTTIEFLVRDKDGVVVSGDKPIAMNDPENLPKHDGWIDLGAPDYVPVFPLALDNPYEVKGYINLRAIGNDQSGFPLKDILNNNTKTPTNEVEIETADGSWVGNIYLPDGSSVPAGSKVQIICNSGWNVNVYYPNVQAGGWISRSMGKGDVLTVMLTDYNRNVWMAPGDPLPDYVPEFPLTLDKPYEVKGQHNLNMIGNDQTGALLKDILNNNTKTPTNEVEIQTYGDEAWVEKIYLPDGASVPAGSKIQITCKSRREVYVAYPNMQTGGWRLQYLKTDEVRIFILSPYNNAWVVPGDINHSEYVFGNNIYSATLKPEWVKPGMTLEFTASNGARGVLEAKVGGVTELIITSLDGGFLTEPQSGFHFRDDPTTNQEYFETIMATRLIAVQYETIHLTEIMLPTGIFYNNISSDEGNWNSGDMIEHGRILLSHGIELANYGISSSLAQSESPHPFTCAFLSAHNIMALYKNGKFNHGWYWTNKNGIITLYHDGSIGNQFSKMVGSNFGLGDNEGGFDGSVHRPADETNSAWGWDSRNNLLIPNFHYSNTGESQCLAEQCQSPFMGKFKYNTDVMAGSHIQLGSNRYPMYTPHVMKKIQEFLESKAIWDDSSSTGFRKYDASSGEMKEFVNEANGNKAPRLHRVPVTTIVGYYEPDSGRGFKSYVYPALYGALGFVYDDDGDNGAGGCELVVKTKKTGNLVYNLDTFVDPKGMNKFHVNVATADEPYEASLFCQKKLLTVRALNGPREDQPALTYTVIGYSEDEKDSDVLI